jgi:hypothetical protein
MRDQCGVPLVDLPAGDALRVRGLRILACKNQRLIGNLSDVPVSNWARRKQKNRTQFHNLWMANMVNLYCIVGATEAPAFNREKYLIRWYWVGGR